MSSFEQGGDVKVRRLALLLPLIVVAARAEAGWMLSSSLEYQTFAFRPRVVEATPNYHGYGLELGGGYSLGRLIDAQLYGRYTPSRLESARFNADEVAFYSYGGTLGLRLAETVYLGVGGGPHVYKLKRQVRTDEVPGEWQGTGAFVALGAFAKIDRQTFTQLAVRFGTASLQRSDQSDANKRKVDTFAVSVTYLWNAEDHFKLSNSTISDFVDSLNFF